MRKQLATAVMNMTEEEAKRVWSVLSMAADNLRDFVVDPETELTEADRVLMREAAADLAAAELFEDAGSEALAALGEVA
jgi:hypothetical protein